MRKKLIALLFCTLLFNSAFCFAADVTAQTTDKQVKTEVKSTAEDKQNVTVININRTWFCFINKGFKSKK